jgi:hypothetical protein
MYSEMHCGKLFTKCCFSPPQRIDACRREHLTQCALDSKRLLQRNRNVQAVLEGKQVRRHAPWCIQHAARTHSEGLDVQCVEI